MAADIFVKLPDGGTFLPLPGGITIYGNKPKKFTAEEFAPVAEALRTSSVGYLAEFISEAQYNAIVAQLPSQGDFNDDFNNDFN